MKLALLVGANPRTSEGGPRVKLGEGVWRIAAEGLIDSQINVSLGGTPSTHSTDAPVNKVTGPVDIQIGFEKRGKEDHISVYAELL